MKTYNIQLHHSRVGVSWTGGEMEPVEVTATFNKVSLTSLTQGNVLECELGELSIYFSFLKQKLQGEQTGALVSDKAV